MTFNLVLDLIDEIKRSAPPGYKQDEQDFESDWLPNCDKIKCLYLTWDLARMDIDIIDRTCVLITNFRLDPGEIGPYEALQKSLENILRRNR